MELGERIASILHEDWRKTRLNGEGKFEPRWKTIKDEAFIASLDENALPHNIRKTETGYEIDIANSTYDELSPDWQAENKAAGQVVAEIINSGTEYTLDEVGDIIHNAWLERNEWAKGDEKLGVPFAKLSKEEQDKDLRQYLLGLDVYQQMKAAKKEDESE